MCEALLADVKNYLNITWDDQATDLKNKQPDQKTGSLIST